MDDWSPRTVRRPGGGTRDIFSPASQPTVGLGLQGDPWLVDAQAGRPRCHSDVRGEGRAADSQRAAPLPWAPTTNPAPPLSRTGSLGLPKLVTGSMWSSPASESDLPLYSPSVPLSRQASSSSRHGPGCSPLATRATLAADDHPAGPLRRSSSPSPYSSRSVTPLIPFNENDGLESGASSRTGSTTSSSDVPSTKTFDPLELGLRALRSLGGDRDATPRSTGALPLSSAMRLFATGSVLSRRTNRTKEPGSGTASPARTPNMRSLALPLTGSPVLRSRRSTQTLGLMADTPRNRSRSIQNRFREQERSKVLQKRIDVLTAVGAIAVLGTVVLLVRMLFLPSGSAPPSTRKGATSNLFPQRDTLALYRIIGNDLPPRHSPGQTLTNLRFLLEHEDDFGALPSLSSLSSSSPTKRHGSKKPSRSLFGPGGRDRLKVEKFYVLNRLANATQIASVRGLLEEYAVEQDHVLEIPFEWDEYKKRSWTWDREVGWGEGMEAVWGIGRKAADNVTRELPREVSVAALIGTGSTEQDVLSSEESWFTRKEAMARLRALDYTYHQKNLYAMNNNGGRNFALDHGRSLSHARWILPLDGNCFFTPSSMFALAHTLAASEVSTGPRHVVIPMARTLSNDQALVNNSFVPASAAEATGKSPTAPDEPQVGFRWDSAESYSENMRYGRRSKLELLWRLGAIGRARDLGKRSHPWEATDRKLLSQHSHGSIRTAVEEGRPLAGYFEAGWVLRLFSGDMAQEEHSPAAMTRRSVNRIKGIVSFLEVLDEGVARAIDECDDDNCGFDAWRLWTWDGGAIEKLQHEYAAGVAEAKARVERFTIGARARLDQLRPRLEKGGWSIKDDKDAEWASSTAAILAMAHTLTGQAEFRAAATQLIYARFLRPVDSESRHHVDTRELDVGQGDGVGYAFPIPRHSLTPSWLKARHTALPFDPLTFDPTLLLDAVRLLSDDWRPDAEGHHAWEDDPELDLPYAELDDLFTAQLSHLLLHPAARAECADPQHIGEGAVYDLKLAALAAFANDAQILGRIANRSRLRLAEGDRGADALHAKLLAGLRNVKLRPFDGSVAGHEWSSAGQKDLWMQRIAAVRDGPFRALLE